MSWQKWNEEHKKGSRPEGRQIGSFRRPNLPKEGPTRARFVRPSGTHPTVQPEHLSQSGAAHTHVSGPTPNAPDMVSYFNGRSPSSPVERAAGEAESASGAKAHQAAAVFHSEQAKRLARPLNDEDKNESDSFRAVGSRRHLTAAKLHRQAAKGGPGFGAERARIASRQANVLTSSVPL